MISYIIQFLNSKCHRERISETNFDELNQTNLVFFRFWIGLDFEFMYLLSMITVLGLQIILAKSMYLNVAFFSVEQDAFV